MTHYSNTCLLLEWSSQAAPPTSEATPTLLGYRVYVNGIAEGQVRPVYLTNIQVVWFRWALIREELIWKD